MGKIISKKLDASFASLFEEEDCIRWGDVKNIFFSDQKERVDSPRFNFMLGKRKTSWQLNWFKVRETPGSPLGLYLQCMSFQEKPFFEEFRIRSKFIVADINGNPFVEKGSEYNTYTAENFMWGYRDFIDITSCQRLRQVQDDDKFVLLCLLEFGPESVTGNLHKLLDEEILTDITLCSIIDGKKRKCHKSLLAIHSSVFRAIFGDEVRENESNRFSHHDLEGDMMDSMLDFIYKGFVYDLDAVCIKLFKTAERYLMPELSNHCQRGIAESLSTSNFVEAVKLAHLYATSGLNDICYVFFERNFREIYATESWRHLERTRPDLAIVFWKRLVATRTVIIDGTCCLRCPT